MPSHKYHIPRGDIGGKQTFNLYDTEPTAIEPQKSTRDVGGKDSISLRSDVVEDVPVRPLTASIQAKQREMMGNENGGDHTGSLLLGDEPSKPRNMSNLKQAEMTGHNIFNGSAPPLAVGTPAGEDRGEGEPAVDAEHKATVDDFKNIMLKDLRVMCRERGVNPAGGKEALVERMLDAQAAGTIPPIMFKEMDSAGMSNYVVNNHARTGGQNVGNFISEKPTSRVLHAPGGGSSIDLGDVPANVPISGRMVTPAKKAEILGNDVFNLTDVEEATPEMSESRRKQMESLAGGVAADILVDHKDVPTASPEASQLTESMAHLQADLNGNGIFDEPLPMDPNGNVADLQGARAVMVEAMRGSDVFSDETGPVRNAIGGVRKDPGGGSSLVLGGGTYPDRPVSARQPPGGNTTFSFC